jgi:hypothetical protein
MRVRLSASLGTIEADDGLELQPVVDSVRVGGDVSAPFRGQAAATLPSRRRSVS